MTIGKTTDVRSDSIQKWNRESNTCFFSFFIDINFICEYILTFEVLNMFYDFQDLKGKVLVGKVLVGKVLVGKVLLGQTPSGQSYIGQSPSGQNSSKRQNISRE